MFSYDEGRLIVDTGRRRAIVRGREVPLSATEYKLLELFARHPSNPILTAGDWPYPAHTVFNAGACQFRDETILLVRVEDRRGHAAGRGIAARRSFEAG